MQVVECQSAREASQKVTKEREDVEKKQLQVENEGLTLKYKTGYEALQKENKMLEIELQGTKRKLCEMEKNCLTVQSEQLNIDKILHSNRTVNAGRKTSNESIFNQMKVMEMDTISAQMDVQERLQSDLTEAEMNKLELKNKNDALIVELRELKRKFDLLQQEKQTLEDLSAEKDTVVCNLNLELMDFRDKEVSIIRERDSLRENVIELENSITKYAVNIQQMEEESNNYKLKCKQSITEQKNQIQSLSKDLVSTQKSESELICEVGNLKQVLENTNETIMQLKATIFNQEKDIKNYVQTLDEKDSEFSNLTSSLQEKLNEEINSNSALSLELETSKQNEQSLQQRLAEIIDQLDSSNTNAITLEKNISDKEIEFKQFTKELNDKEQTINELSATLQQKEEQFEDVNQQLLIINANFSQLENEKESLAANLVKKEESLSKIYTDKNTIQAEYVKLQNELDAVNFEVNAVSSHKTELEKVAAENRETIEQYKSENNTLSQQLRNSNSELQENLDTSKKKREDINILLEGKEQELIDLKVIVLINYKKVVKME